MNTKQAKFIRKAAQYTDRQKEQYLNDIMAGIFSSPLKVRIRFALAVVFKGKDLRKAHKGKE